jgi:hypothetical protein
LYDRFNATDVDPMPALVMDAIIILDSLVLLINQDTQRVFMDAKEPIIEHFTPMPFDRDTCLDMINHLEVAIPHEPLLVNS